MNKNKYKISARYSKQNIIKKVLKNNYLKYIHIVHQKVKM